MAFKGSYQSYDSKTMASAAATYLPISAKDSREICKAIKGKKLDTAIKYLQAVINRKLAVPYKRYNRDTPHRRGNMAAGRFPRKASEFILQILKGLKANAAGKNLDEENLLLVHAAAQRGPVLWHYGRHRGTRRKCTYFEAVAKEIVAKEITPKSKISSTDESKIRGEKKEKPKEIAEKKEAKEKPKVEKKLEEKPVEKEEIKEPEKEKSKKKPAKKKEEKK